MNKQDGNKSFLEQEAARVRAKAARNLMIVLIVTAAMGVAGLITAIYGITSMDGFGGTMTGTLGIMMMLAFGFPYSVLKNGWSQVLEKEIASVKKTEVQMAEGQRKNREKKEAEERAAAQRLKELEEEEANGFPYAIAEEFYRACVKQGIRSMDSEVNKQRALLIAKNDPRFNAPGYEELCTKMFTAGRDHINAAAQAASARKEESKVSSARQSDVQAAAVEKEIFGLFGRDKRVRMLQEKLRPVNERLNEILKNERELMSAVAAVGQIGMEKETGWGTAAGIASGIGGTVAGIAAASGINAQNAGIRERNAARQAVTSRQMSQAFDSLEKTNGATKRDLRRQIEQVEKEIEKTALKLMDENVPAQELAAALTLGKPRVRFTKGRTMEIQVDVSGGGGHLIAGEVPAAIDGSILAEVYEGKKLVGRAYLNLPLYGVDGSEARVTLTAHCLEAAPDRNYEVRLIPQAMWLIEV